MSSTTAGFHHTELHTTEYVTNQKKVTDNGPGVFSAKAINTNRATEDVQFDIIDANLSNSLEQAEKFAKIFDLNESMGANFKDLEATEPVWDGPSMESAAAEQEIEVLEEELQIKKLRLTKLEGRLDKCKLEPESTE